MRAVQVAHPSGQSRSSRSTDGAGARGVAAAGGAGGQARAEQRRPAATVAAGMSFAELRCDEQQQRGALLAGQEEGAAAAVADGRDSALSFST
ncbi:hypothetical protein HYH02_003286 [Chlamydomonas schloesseri]|uniref:Uncharacterized protein n=1 Tax=Chlamydomonas schloesseri TaxID=2026947 RepID=A0A835WQX4_9CHLO|nr:hypothetical protein HYH02_003286 [Chlamydomonas schloesseri]|eukprot:KAG2452262.1 hypothetical protein HYH02_003286 [Chlamydomonas schloesseri]